MSTSSNAMPESIVQPGVRTPAHPTRPLCWSMRRELWENRSLYVAPLAGAAVYLLGYFISLMWVPRRIEGLAEQDPRPAILVFATPYSHAAMLLMAIGFLVAFFYSLDALHGERRDRSILFWKSLPVSDLTTVLSKASVPLAVVPLLVFAITVALQIVMLLLSMASLLISGQSAATVWTQVPLFQLQIVFFYVLAVTALWYAPIYCWLMLVSGWARRATFLWAVLPPLAVAVAENIAFRTSYFGALVRYRFFGFAAAAFDLTDKHGVPIDPHFIPLAQLAPARFLSSPGLWLGLLVAAIFLAASVRLRRYQGPI